jgi:hypothetical protein
MVQSNLQKYLGSLLQKSFKAPGVNVFKVSLSSSLVLRQNKLECSSLSS